MNKKMKIVVIGGSGLIGKKLVNNLRQQGHEVVAASPSSGVNTLTGEGLEEALADQLPSGRVTFHLFLWLIRSHYALFVLMCSKAKATTI
jgi:nucleoside-diphosphate-sugar epimerase